MEAWVGILKSGKMHIMIAMKAAQLCIICTILLNNFETLNANRWIPRKLYTENFLYSKNVARFHFHLHL